MSDSMIIVETNSATSNINNLHSNQTSSSQLLNNKQLLNYGALTIEDVYSVAKEFIKGN